MLPQLKKGNWESSLYERLTQFIESHASSPETPEEERAYVVFDFDNTAIFNDIEDCLMMYMATHLAYKLTPSEYMKVVLSGPFDFDEPLDPKWTETTIEDLALDLAELYQSLYENKPQEPSLEEWRALQSSALYRTYTAKIRLYYTFVNKHFSRTPGKTWPGYLFAGYKRDELIQLAKDSLLWGLGSEMGMVSWLSAEELPGRTGVVQAKFESGLRVTDELMNLFQVLQAHNIDCRIVSASPKDVVQTAAVSLAYVPSSDYVIGMSHSYQADGRAENLVQDGKPTTKGQGKVNTIKAEICPRYQGRGPLAVFGDSMGDFEMLSAFEETELSVLFNRCLDDPTQELVKEAVHSHQKPGARYFLQGRDENCGRLRPSQASILLGQDEESLYADDITD